MPNLFRFRLAAAFVAVASFVLTGCGGSSSEAPPAQVTVENDVDYNTALQAATFADLNGNTVRLSDFKGKTVMIDFWETWCTPCLKAFPSMSKAMKDFPDSFVVLAVNLGESDLDADVARFRDSNPDYPFVWLKDTGLADQLQVPGIPFKIFVAPDGTYHSHELGLSGSEDANYTKLAEFIQSQQR